MAAIGECEDSEFTCSVCFEPYGGGREAKLLPCLHTFCLPCLAGLATRGEVSQTSGQGDDSEEGRQCDSLTCPTCRRVIPLPPGGVTGFQRSFYPDSLSREGDAPGPVTCALCEGDQTAQFLCGRCHNHFCSLCQHAHNKLCQGSQVTALPPPPHSSNSSATQSTVQSTTQSTTQSTAQSTTQSTAQSTARSEVRQQLQMVEEVLKKLREEEMRLNHEKAAMDQGIDIRFNMLVRHAAVARDACFRSKTQACHHLTEHVHSLMEEARQTRDTLQQRLSPSQPAPDPASTLRATLFLEGEGERILNRDLDYLLLDHRMEDNRAVLTQALQAFMGSVVSSHQASGPALSKEPAELLPLQDHRGAVSSAQASPRDLNDLYQKVEDLAGQVTSLQSANTQLTQHVTLLSNAHSKLSTEHGALKREVTSLREKNGQLTSGQASLQREVTSLREKNDQLTSGQASLQREVRALRDKQAIAHQDLAVLTAEKDKACAGLAKLQKDVLSIQTDASLQQTDILRLKADHGQVAAKLSAVQTDTAVIRTDITAMKANITAMQTDIKALQGAEASVKKDVDQLKKDCGQVKKDCGQVKKDVDQLKKDCGQLTSDVAQTQGKLSNLESRFATANTQVGFTAWMSEDVTTSERQTLVCDDITTNEGGGYDEDTGLFTAPVTGTYCFVATTGPDDADKAAILDIIVDGDGKGYVHSEGRSWSSGHTVVKLTCGQTVWLESYGDGEYTFSGGVWTQFSGMLLQAEV